MKVRSSAGLRDRSALWFEDGKLIMIDQRALPHRMQLVSYSDSGSVAEAIRNMVIRGAPSIGAAAAYGMALACLKKEDLRVAAETLKSTRPTANDLFYAVDYMLMRIDAGDDPISAAEAYAQNIIDKCMAIGRYGSGLIRNGDIVMTHCNAGALATVDVGTALAPIRVAWNEGKRFTVIASETRPRLQGLQLTAWELIQEGIEHAVIVDGASGHFMRKGVNMVIVGADRIAANGDFANKIGTFEKAVLAKEAGVPFYVAAPASTFDFDTSCGEDIVIEDRSSEELTMIGGKYIAPQGVNVLNPAFDMTPARYVTAYVTEKGILSKEQISSMRG
ncbi:MAG TPA: S-methyl-5-thioribose-1-phosphate isomerase [Candidatus Methanomethylophilaceae archaeon]|nr:S-methyl-5-thioribose-1-phosphate isomerase [Candidatus Methanomethylophilaceae archaeon]